MLGLGLGLGLGSGLRLGLGLGLGSGLGSGSGLGLGLDGGGRAGGHEHGGRGVARQQRAHERPDRARYEHGISRAPLQIGGSQVRMAASHSAERLSPTEAPCTHSRYEASGRAGMLSASALVTACHRLAL